MLDDVMPHVRVGSDDATTLIVTLVDPHTNFEVDLSYTAIHALDCIARSATFRAPPSQPFGRRRICAHSQGDERLCRL